jgi:hypothetical protein
MVNLSRRMVIVLTGLQPVVACCTSFATVRSAEVLPGPSLGIQASASTRPGDVAAWFWSYDCAENCDHVIPGGDVGFTYGWPRQGRIGAFALGAGLSGTFPYADGYLQLASGRTPFGVGARLGLPLMSWREHQLYGRYDVRLGESTRLLLNPALFFHEGETPNGETPGSFRGFVQGVGLLFEGETVSWTPAIALVAGRARRRDSSRQYGPERSVFGTASLGLTFHRRRTPER